MGNTSSNEKKDQSGLRAKLSSLVLALVLVILAAMRLVPQLAPGDGQQTAAAASGGSSSYGPAETAGGYASEEPAEAETAAGSPTDGAAVPGTSDGREAAGGYASEEPAASEAEAGTKSPGSSSVGEDGPAVGTAGENGSAAALTFRSSRLLSDHYQKHGIEMGFSSAEEYEAAAAAVAGNPNALHKTEEEDGDDVYYVEETNEFVVVSTDGYIRTYFNPSGGINYFNRQ